MLAHQLGVLQVNRARVRLLFRDADFRQELDQDLGLDLQFARQFIDTDLIGICHSPLSSLVPCPVIHDFGLHFSSGRRTSASRTKLRFFCAVFCAADCFLSHLFASLFGGLIEGFRLGFRVRRAHWSIFLRSRHFVRGDLFGGFLGCFIY